MSDVRYWKTKAVLAKAQELKQFDDANPEVGMPPTWQMYIDDALKILNLSKDEVNYRKLI